MATQIEIQQELNSLAIKRIKSLRIQSAEITKQIGLATGLSNALKGFDVDDVINSIQRMTDALTNSADEVEDLGQTSAKNNKKITASFAKSRKAASALVDVLEDASNEFPIMAAGAFGFFEGIKDGFGFSINLLTSMFDLVTSIGGAIFDISSAVVSIPFRIFEGLVETSNKLTGYLEAIARATEEVRAQFGELTTGPGLDVINLARDLGTTLTATGLTGYQVFGSLDEAIQFVNKTAGEMGNVFEVVRNQFEGEMGPSLFMLQKGLGLTGQQLGDVARRSRAMGTDLNKELTTIAKTSLIFGKRFNLSAKGISRDIATMIGDAKNFGNLAPEELVKVSISAKKLGVEIKDLQGIIGGFDFFEDAAINAAKLGQAFGINVDAMKLFNAENPADRIEMLKKSFESAGIDAANLGRRDLALLSDALGGMDATAIRTAFATKNAGESMSEMASEASDAKKEQISQEEALQKLTGSIEKLVKTFGQFQKGFVQAFIDGFGRGVFAQKDFVEMLATLNRSLAATKRAGIDVGKAFVAMFPGVEGLVKSFTDLISINSKVKNSITPFSALLRATTGLFKNFFETINEGPEAVKTLFTGLQTSFAAFFESFSGTEASAAGQEFLSAMGNVIAGLLRITADGITSAVDMFVAFLNGDELPDVPGSEFANALLDPIKAEFEKGGAVDKIKDALGKLFEKIWPDIEPYVRKGAYALGAIVFGPAIVGGITSSLFGMLGTALLQSLLTVETGITSASLVSAFSGIASTIAGIIFSAPALIVAAIAAFAGLSVGIKSGIDEFGEEFKKDFENATIGKLGAAVAGVVELLSFGLIPKDGAKGIGKWVADSLKSLTDTITNIFGPETTGVILDFIDSTIETFKSFGDLLVSLWNGDTQAIENAASNFIQNIGETIWNFLKSLGPMIAVVLAGVLNFVTAAVTKVVEWILSAFIGFNRGISYAFSLVSNIIAGVFTGLGELAGKIPILGGAFKWVFDLVATGWREIGNVFSWLTDAYKWLGDGVEGASKKVMKWLGWASDEVAKKQKSNEIANSITPDPKDIDKNAGAVSKSLKNMTENQISILAESTPKIKKEADLLAKATSFSFGEAEKSVTGFKNELSSLKDFGTIPINIEAKLKKRGKDLGLEDEEIMVKTGKTNILLNLNITMDSGQIATAVAETRKVIATSS